MRIQMFFCDPLKIQYVLIAMKSNCFIKWLNVRDYCFGTFSILNSCKVECHIYLEKVHTDHRNCLFFKTKQNKICILDKVI